MSDAFRNYDQWLTTDPREKEDELRQDLCNHCFEEDSHDCIEEDRDAFTCVRVDRLVAEHYEEIRNNKLSRKRHGYQREEK